MNKQGDLRSTRIATDRTFRVYPRACCGVFNLKNDAPRFGLTEST